MRHFDHENVRGAWSCRAVLRRRHTRSRAVVQVLGIDDLQPPESYEKFKDVYIVSELMETDLHRIIYSKQQLSEEHIQYFVYQMLCALKYMVRGPEAQAPPARSCTPRRPPRHSTPQRSSTAT